MIDARQFAAAYTKRREALARILAASVMGMINDPLGQHLPDECWQQMTAKADAIFSIISAGPDKGAAGRALEQANR